MVFLETHCHALYHINERVGALVPITVDQLRQRLTTNLSIEGQSFINILAVPENTPIDKSSVPADDELKSVFSRIYANQVWNNGDASVPLSGPGSALKNTTHIIEALDEFVRTRRIQSVVDLGCGDLTWMQNTAFFSQNRVRYTGIDIVRSVIQDHQKNHPNIVVSHNFYLMVNQ